MDEQALNKKLAEWAGFYQRIMESSSYWHDKDNIWISFNPPVFTQSLDACFKWLVPKAVVKLAGIDLSTVKEATHKLFQLWAEQDAESHALALCLAIEKLIGNDNPAN